MRACARCFAALGGKTPAAGDPGRAGRPFGLAGSLMPAAGRQAGWVMLIGRGGTSHCLIWLLRSPCGQGFSPSPRTNTCWWPCCTISPPMAGPSRCWWRDLGMAYASSVCGAGPRLGAVGGAVCRLHAVAARCTLVNSKRSATAAIAAQLAYWEVCPGRHARCVLYCPTDRRLTRRLPISAAPVWRCEWPAELQQQVARGGRVSTMRPVSW